MTGDQVPMPHAFRTASVPAEQSLAVLGSDDLAARLRAIQSVSDAALAHLKLDAMLGALLQRVRDALDVDAVRVLLCTPAGTELSVRAALGLEEEDGGPAIPVPIGTGIAGWVAHNHTAVIVDNVAEAAVANPLIRRLATVMVAPLLVEGNLLGVLKVGTTRPRRFTEADLGLLQLVADRVALAIDRARQFERTEEAERRLRHREMQYRSLFDHNPAAVFALDTEGHFTSLNPAAERISGYSADEWLGRSFLPLIVEKDGEHALEAFRRTLQGEPSEFQVGVRAKNGSEIVFRIIAVPVKDGDEVTGVYGIAEDVTERIRQAAQQRQLVEELQAERRQLDAVLQQMPAGVMIVEAPSGRVIRGNPRIEEILRHPIDATESFADYAKWSGLRPDGRPMEPEEWPLARAVLHGETINGEEILYDRGDGTQCWIRVNAAPVRDTEGRIVAGVAVVHDAELEKRAAEEMSFLADVSSALHSTLSYRDTLRHVARLAVPRFSDWCVVDLVDENGQVQRQEAAHRDPEREHQIRELQRRYPTHYDQPGHPIGQVLRTGEPVLIPEFADSMIDTLADDTEHAQILRALGVRSLLVVPIRGRERILGVIVFATAGGERRFTEHDLALAEEIGRRSALAIENSQLFEAASDASRAKTDFLAVMSHELRTPLAAIMGYAELLQMGIPTAVPEPALRQVERIDSAARHQLQLIEEILTFSRLSSGNETVVWSRVDVAAPVRDAVAFIRPAAEKKSLDLRLNLPDTPLEVETDASKLRQVLINLLFNAVQFTPSGEIAVDVTAAAVGFRVRVRDTGIGIAPEHRRKIFEPFWQVKQSSTREVGGTGLGLTVAQRTIAVMGGELSVESEVGAGSTFTVWLPLSAAKTDGGAA